MGSGIAPPESCQHVPKCFSRPSSPLLVWRSGTLVHVAKLLANAKTLPTHSVNAAAIAAGKTFKFQVENSKGKYFLGENGMSTQDESKALICELAADVLKCGGKGFRNFSGDMLKLAPSNASGGSTGWSIDAKDMINWSAQKEMKFSLGISGSTDVYAEVCPHHFTDHGNAKAIWVV